MPIFARIAYITPMQTQSFKVFINELADMSGEYIAKSFGKRHSVDFKEDSSPVTEVDKNVECMLREAISKKFPDHGIIGEEYGNSGEGAEYVWVLDPIDGTKSFISAVPLFGTLIALMKNGEPVLGAINQPVLSERIVGDCEECLFNGRRVSPSRRTSLEGMTLLTSDSRYCSRLRGEAGWKRLEDAAAISRTWGDCYGYMLLCRGYADVMADALLEVWDFAALLPALKGAGIAYSDWRGGRDIGHDWGLIASCTPELHKKVLAAVSGGV